MHSESDFVAIPRFALAAVLARAVRRSLPIVGQAVPKYGDEVWEWFNAIHATVHVVEAVARGESLSRFTLDLAAEIARTTANATSAAARQQGPSALVESLELVYAAAAFAADALRTDKPDRVKMFAFQSVRAAVAALPEQERLVAFDMNTLTGWPADSPVNPTDDGPLGELWPRGEPSEWAAILDEFAKQTPCMPRLLSL